MMKKLNIVMFIVFLIFIFQLICCPIQSKANALDDTIQRGNAFWDEGNSHIGSDKVESLSNTIFNVLFGIGVAITLIVGGFLGIKFMMASVEDKAKIKEALIPYVLGCIVIYGAFGIWKLTILILDEVV